MPRTAVQKEQSGGEHKIVDTKGVLAGRIVKRSLTGHFFMCIMLPNLIKLYQWAQHPYNRFLQVKVTDGALAPRTAGVVSADGHARRTFRSRLRRSHLSWSSSDPGRATPRFHFYASASGATGKPTRWSST